MGVMIGGLIINYVVESGDECKGDTGRRWMERLTPPYAGTHLGQKETLEVKGLAAQHGPTIKQN